MIPNLACVHFRCQMVVPRRRKNWFYDLLDLRLNPAPKQIGPLTVGGALISRKLFGDDIFERICSQSCPAS
jgi:hypothetical protein